MQTTEPAFFKTLPKLTKPDAQEFNLDTRVVDNWFNTLPLANIRVATKTIYLFLKESNNYETSFKKRLYFLEKIHVPLIGLTESLQKLNLNREFPLPNKHNNIALLIQKLHYQMSIGFKLVLRDLSNFRGLFLSPGKRKSMIQVIERIIRHHSLSLVTSYQLYNPLQKGLWSEIQQLFFLAHQEKLLDKSLTEPSLQLVQSTTIKSAFLQILLISLADPFRMTQHQTYAIFQQLEEWVSLADLSLYQGNDDEKFLAIDLSQDTAPAFMTPTTEKKINSTWMLDTSKLNYANLFEHFDTPTTQTTEIDIELLKQLSLAWGISPNRQHNRQPAKSRLQVTIGLNNIHYALNGYSEPQWLQDNFADEQVLILSKEHQPGTYFSQSSRVNMNSDAENKEDVDLNQSSTNGLNQKNNSQAPQEWEMINESIGGYCLLWDNEASTNAKVGEIIAISHETEKKATSWIIGTICWMKCVDKHKVKIGVQIMAPSAVAVSASKSSSLHEGIKARAIALPAIPLLKQPKTLITIGLDYALRDDIYLDEYHLDNGKMTSLRTKIVLIEALEMSSHFTRFQYALPDGVYQTTDHPPPPERISEDILSLDSKTEFDSLWDEL